MQYRPRYSYWEINELLCEYILSTLESNSPLRGKSISNTQKTAKQPEFKRFKNLCHEPRSSGTPLIPLKA
ncbi:MAG: hypothetical protein COA78_08505 [Blastopirellula sp.]|nr:MAG: hypothetical protein COA78_08505 [Blastopirellula sp.]